MPITRRQFVRYATATSVAFRSYRLTAATEPPHDSEGPAQAAAPPDVAAVRKLASQTVGRVITPDSPDYDLYRLVFNLAFDKRPALIVRCARADDVARALEFAQRRDLRVAVRGGGHNRAGLSICDGGVLIDLATMNEVAVNGRVRVARAQAGALTVQVDAATQRYGLATTLAGCPTVGIAGLTLGGGEGLLMSKYGLACDNLVSVQLLTVDGRQVKASLASNPDLFWAIRGGGGNFGVALVFEYRLHRVTDVLAGTLVYPVGETRQRLEVFAQVAASAPDEFNVVGIVSATERGPRFQMIVGHCGDPRQGNDLLNPLRALTPQEDTVRTMSYLQANATINPAAPVAHFQTDLVVRQLDTDIIAVITAATDAAPPNSRVFMVPIYGAVTRVRLNDTAYPLRHTGCELDIMGRWQDPRDKDAAVQWVKALRDKLRPFATGAYVNQMGETSEDLVRTAYGPNYSRLAQLKGKYDPNNVLQSNQNIRPS